MPIRLRGGGGGGSAPPAETVATRNILNGVLNCAWDKTSAAPKLLEIYENSQVKLNVDSDNPLVLAFANGWDDLDRPAQVVKRLAVAPANIDLSAKANCKVQIVAKVINDELVITTHDIYDPAVGYGSAINPVLTNDSPKNGWSISASSIDSSNYPAWKGNAHLSGGYDRWSKASYENPGYLYFTAPIATAIASCSVEATGGYPVQLMAKNLDTEQWENISNSVTPSGSPRWVTLTISAILVSNQFRLKVTAAGSTAGCRCCDLYEHPTAKFFRSLNKVKDRSDVEQLWINLGYATVNAAGAITALTHYTDLRNNYPGGMRVEA